MEKSSTLATRINAYLPPLIWAVLIFFLSDQSTLPGPSYPLLDNIFKQGAHVFVYAILHFLVLRAMKLTTNSAHLQTKHFLVPILITFFYALSDEFHQSFIPGRQATLVDIGFDSIGIAISHYLTHQGKQLHSDKPQNR